MIFYEIVLSNGRFSMLKHQWISSKDKIELFTRGKRERWIEYDISVDENEKVYAR